MELFHPLLEATREIGNDHVRELFFEKDPFGALIAALQSMNKYPHRHVRPINKLVAFADL
jgi:hypothetical protein